jgi:NADPH:quinone reductase-like Zn-dependent oxidoreductase
MKAMVHTQYGPPSVLRFMEMVTPAPRENEVLLRVQAASATAGDWHLVRGEPFMVRMMFGLRKPKHAIPGADVAGTVEAVGNKVTRFQPGDTVFGDLSGNGYGAFAEYVSVPEQSLAHTPEGLSLEQAAAVPVAAVTALQGLRDHGHIRAGQQVLINGASGGVGTFAVQIARAFGAEVTGVCSARKAELVRSIGADHVIDYKQEDITRSDRQYDLIIDTAARHSLFDYRRALRPGGRYVMIGGSTGRLLQAMTLGPLLSRFGDKTMSALMMQPRPADLEFVKELIETGNVKPVIDRCFPLHETAEALQYLEAGRAAGKIVINVAG